LIPRDLFFRWLTLSYILADTLHVSVDALHLRASSLAITGFPGSISIPKRYLPRSSPLSCFYSLGFFLFSFDPALSCFFLLSWALSVRFVGGLVRSGNGWLLLFTWWTRKTRVFSTPPLLFSRGSAYVRSVNALVSSPRAPLSLLPIGRAAVRFKVSISSGTPLYPSFTLIASAIPLSVAWLASLVSCSIYFPDPWFFLVSFAALVRFVRSPCMHGVRTPSVA